MYPTLKYIIVLAVLYQTTKTMDAEYNKIAADTPSEISTEKKELNIALSNLLKKRIVDDVESYKSEPNPLEKKKMEEESCRYYIEQQKKIKNSLEEVEKKHQVFIQYTLAQSWDCQKIKSLKKKCEQELFSIKCRLGYLCYDQLSDPDAQITYTNAMREEKELEIRIHNLSNALCIRHLVDVTTKKPLIAELD